MWRTHLEVLKGAVGQRPLCALVEEEEGLVSEQHREQSQVEQLNRNTCRVLGAGGVCESRPMAAEATVQRLHMAGGNVDTPAVFHNASALEDALEHTHRPVARRLCPVRYLALGQTIAVSFQVSCLVGRLLCGIAAFSNP